MMKRTCIQCNKEFELNQSEIAFYKKKKLSLPKRCKECRELNKQKKNGKKNQGGAEQKKDSRQKDAALMKTQKEKAVKYQEPEKQMTVTAEDTNIPKKKKKSGKQRLAYIAAALLLGVGGGGAAFGSMSDTEPTQPVAIEQSIEVEDELQQAEILYEFRNDEFLENHYKKHGIEMGFDSEEEYLEGANRVIASPDVLQKTEAEDGDFVYYLESTNEFVIVSKDGYLRTYFNPSDGIEYYNRQ